MVWGGKIVSLLRAALCSYKKEEGLCNCSLMYI